MPFEPRSESALHSHKDWCSVCDRYSVHVRGCLRVSNVTTLFGAPDRVLTIQCQHCLWVTYLDH